MINWKSIISSFNDKPTLLEWLKIVEKALKESVLTSITTEQDANKDNTKLIFNFEDGTKIETGFFPTRGATGAKGVDGVSITGIDTVSDEVVGDETLTTLRAHYSNNTTDEFVVTAKNGKDGGGGKLFVHALNLTDTTTNESYTVTFYASFNTQITYANILDFNAKIPFGVVYKVDNNGDYSFEGIITDLSQGTRAGTIIIDYPGITPKSLLLLFNSDYVTEV